MVLALLDRWKRWGDQFIANASQLQQIFGKESIALAATKRNQCAAD
jgi:hypothetical protein